MSGEHQPEVLPVKSTDSARMSAVWALFFVVIVWAGVYLPGLGSEELKGEEPRRALPGLTMRATGDWVSPVIGGQPYHRKPPLINWMAVGGVMLTGKVDEFSVRWPGTVVILLFALSLTAATAKAAGWEAGLIAGLASLTCVSLVDKGRLVEIEGLYVALTGLAFSAWFGWAWVGAKRWLGWAAAGVFLGLGFLAKGPPHLVMFYAVVLGMMWRARRLKELRHPAHVFGLVLATVVALPWFRASYAVSGNEGGAGWWEQISSRLDFSQIVWGDWALQILQGGVNFLPWMLLLLPLLVPRWRRALGVDDADRLVSGLALGVVVGYFLIALTPAARPRFTMPLIGPASVLVGIGWMRARGAGMDRVMLWGRRALRVLVPLVLLVGIAAMGVCVKNTGASLSTLWLFPMALALFLTWRLAQSNCPARMALGGAFLSMGVVFAYAGALQPMKAQSEEIRPVARHLAERLDDGEVLLVYKSGYRPWVFYLWGKNQEIASWSLLPKKTDALPGPLVMTSMRWDKEGGKLQKRFGTPLCMETFTCTWNQDELLFVRF